MAKKQAMTNYKAKLLERLKDQEYAAGYLRAAAEEVDAPETLLLALRDVAEARGVSSLSKATNLNRVTLYRMLSGRGNPTYQSLCSILGSFGLRLSVTPLSAKAAKEALAEAYVAQGVAKKKPARGRIKKAMTRPQAKAAASG